MTELDSSVGESSTTSSSTSTSVPLLVDASSSSSQNETDSVQDNDDSCTTATTSTSQTKKTWKKQTTTRRYNLGHAATRTQDHLDRTLRLLEHTMQENQNLKHQLKEQVELHKALATKYQTLQEQLAKHVQLYAQQQDKMQQVLQEQKRNKNQSKPASQTLVPTTKAASPSDNMVATLTSWVGPGPGTGLWTWLGMGLVAVTVVGGGVVVMYHIYTDTANLAMQVASQARLTAQNAARSEQAVSVATEKAKMSTHAAARAAQHASEADTSARVSRTAADTATEQVHHMNRLATWMWKRGHRMHGGSAATAEFGERAAAAERPTTFSSASSSWRHYHCRSAHHHHGRDASGTESVTVNHPAVEVAPKTTSTPTDSKMTADTTTARDGMENHWTMPPTSIAVVKAAAVTAIPVLLSFLW